MLRPSAGCGRGPGAAAVGGQLARTWRHCSTPAAGQAQHKEAGQPTVDGVGHSRLLPGAARRRQMGQQVGGREGREGRGGRRGRWAAHHAGLPRSPACRLTARCPIGQRRRLCAARPTCAPRRGLWRSCPCARPGPWPPSPPRRPPVGHRCLRCGGGRARCPAARPPAPAGDWGGRGQGAGVGAAEGGWRQTPATLRWRCGCLPFPWLWSRPRQRWPPGAPSPRPRPPAPGGGPGR